jgi:diguanylate cyclase (GGDEF)-like protein
VYSLSGWSIFAAPPNTGEMKLLKEKVLGNMLLVLSALILVSTVASLADGLSDPFLYGFLPLLTAAGIAVFLLRKDSSPQAGIVFVTAALLNSTVHLWGGATGPAAFLYPIFFLWMKRDSIGGPVLTIAGILGAAEFVTPVISATGLTRGSFELGAFLGILGGSFIAGIIPLVSMLAVEYLKTDRSSGYSYTEKPVDNTESDLPQFPDDIARSLIPILKAGTGAHGIFLFVSERREVWTLNEFVADTGRASARYMVGSDEPVIKLLNESSEDVIHTRADRLSVGGSTGLPWYIQGEEPPWVSIVKFRRGGVLNGFMVLDFDSEEKRRRSSSILVDSVFLLSISWEMGREEADNGFYTMCEEMDASTDIRSAIHKLTGRIVASFPGTTATVAIISRKDTLAIFESRGLQSDGRAGRECSLQEGIAGLAISRRQPVRRLKMGEVKAFGSSDSFENTAGSCCAVPLENRGVILGVLTVESTEEQYFSSDDLSVFKTYATVFGLAVSRNQLQSSIRKLREIDRLTGLPLLSSFYRHLADLVREVRSRAISVAVLAVDIHGFTGINEELGFSAGDEVLGKTARKLQQVLGDRAILSRNGSDSFLICLSGVDKVSAEAYAARILEAFALNLFRIAGKDITILVSIAGAVSHVDRMIPKLPGIAAKLVEKNPSAPGFSAVKEVGQFYDSE